MTTATDVGVYVTAVNVDEIFADPTYQRDLDTGRARTMDAGMGPSPGRHPRTVRPRRIRCHPRYAVIDGQHRWAAAQMSLDPPPSVGRQRA
jgi:hypothetical protein